MDLTAFAEEVGEREPVTCEGSRTQWEVGGLPDPAARLVRAPVGIVAHQPEEMIVRVRAGTPVHELDAALAARDQMCPLDPHDAAATVGGTLAVGRSGPRRLRYGPVRDTVLEITMVSARGRLVRSGAPVVKNVTGYDLPRVLVGSLGTLGILAEVVLRVQPRPEACRWFAGRADPQAVRHSLYRPSSILWDGDRVWVLLEGHPRDVAAEAGRLAGFEEVSGPPPVPRAGRRSVRPSSIPAAAGGRPAGSFVAEIGVGTLHLATPEPPAGPDPSTRALHDRIKQAFDPTGRLNPGRVVA